MEGRLFCFALFFFSKDKQEILLTLYTLHLFCDRAHSTHVFGDLVPRECRARRLTRSTLGWNRVIGGKGK